MVRYQLTNRQEYAAKIFKITTQYDMQISSYLNSDSNEKLSDKISINAIKKDELRYGENPHQKAAFYTSEDNDNSWSQLQGKQLSYNNYTDIESAFSIVNDFEQISCSIIKHANPCGFAIGDNTIQAFERAVSSDPVSYFGGIVGFNSTVDRELAEILVKPFLECIVAPDFDDQSLEVFQIKKEFKINKNFKRIYTFK